MAMIMPCLGIRDLERELKFFVAVGFDVLDRWDMGARVRLEDAELEIEQFDHLRVGDAPLLDWDKSPSQLGSGVQLYFIVDNVDAIAGRIPVGVPRPWPVQDKSWGLRELTLRSPSGYVLTFAQRVRRGQ